MNHFIALSAFILSLQLVFSQTNNGCVDNTGTPLTVSNSCIAQSFNSNNDSDYWNGASGCNATDRDDVWGWFTAVSTSTTINYNASTLLTDPIKTVFSASCNPNMTSLACSNASILLTESLVFPTIPGQAYKVRIQNRASDDTMNGTICIFSTTPVPNAGDNPCSATALTVGGVCNRTYFTNTIATNTNTPGSPGCGYSAPENDVWFSTTMPASGNLQIDTEASFGGMTNAAMAVYSGALCSGLTFVSCDQSSSGANMPQINITPAQIAPGQPVWIRVWAEAGSNGIFGICATNTTACGNPMGLLNDFCENPAFLTKNAGASFSASTAGVFTPDLSGLIDFNGIGCVGGPGNIIMQNNSWYQFTASAVTETFNFTATSCVGVQALVYRVTKDAAGCCVGLNQMSNCISSMPMHPAGSSTITASGLTIGSNYVLMVDGFNGAGCDFTISGWGAIGVLPIELTKFSALSLDNRNEITWVTESEHNNDYFNLHRSFDGENFEIIATIDGAGNSTQLLNYTVSDYDIRFGTVYYQLEQIDFDGQNSKSQIVALNRNDSENGLVNVYPNPTEDMLTIDINVSTQEGGFVRIEGVNGILVYEQKIEGKGVHQITHDMTFLSSGLYFIRYLDEEVNSVKTILKK